MSLTFPSEVYSEFLAYCSVSALDACAQVHPALAALVDYELIRRFLHTLAWFVAHPRRLRDVMALTGAIVTGPTVLQYFEGCPHWHSSCLHLITPLDHFHDMRRYLIDVEGYKTARFAPSPYDPTGPDNTLVPFIDQLSRFTPALRCSVTLYRQNVTIHLCCSKSYSALYPLPYIWSTLEMNYISARGVGSAYPVMTFERTGVLTSRRLVHMPYAVQQQLQAYRARLYTLASSRYELNEAGRDVTMGSIYRTFADRHAWNWRFRDEEEYGGRASVGACPGETGQRWTSWFLGTQLATEVTRLEVRTFEAV